MPKGYRHGGFGTPEYTAWQNMKDRCHNKNSPRYAEWGGTGIAVCPEWMHSFPTFLADMGRRPTKDHSLDRIDGSLGYMASNCRWATKREQSENRPTFVNRIEFGGKTQSISAWAREVGISRESLRSRLDNGWSLERALTTPRNPMFAGYVSVQVLRERELKP